MTHYKDTKAIAHLPNDDSYLIEIVGGILQGNTLAQFLSIIYLDYVPRTSIDLMKEMVTYRKRQKTNDIQQKLISIQTTQMIEYI